MPDATTTAVRTKWIAAYSDFLLAVLGLRRLDQTECNLGISQEIFADKATRLLELADELNSLGACPALVLAGEEGVLWQAVVTYGTTACWRVLQSGGTVAEVVVAADECRAAWAEFRRTVRTLTDDFERTIPALDPRFLRPEGLTWLFPAAARATHSDRDEVCEATTQDFDQIILR